MALWDDDSFQKMIVTPKITYFMVHSGFPISTTTFSTGRSHVGGEI